MNIYLTPEEINKAYMATDYHPSFKLTHEVNVKRVAKASADNAVRVIIDYIDLEYDEEGELVSYPAPEAWEKLKKLTKTK